MPAASAQYRPLPLEPNDAVTVGGSMRTLHTSRATHSHKLRTLWPKTANSRRIFICVIILMMLFIYVVWCAITNYTVDSEEVAFTTGTDALENKLYTDSQTTLCSESLEDTRGFIQDKFRTEWVNLSLIYFVTPTYPRREQVPELTRLAYTLMHVPRLHWLVADDYNECNEYMGTLLKKFGIPFSYMSSPMPDRFRKVKNKPRGVANRLAAMHWLRQHNTTTGILYFGDDDNTYNLKLFSEIRDTKRVSMFPVGLIEDQGISGPVVRKGKVVGFLDSWVAGRRWPVDMAGFAVNLSYLSKFPNATMPYKPGYEEDFFLRSISLTLDMIEPKGNNCTEILVWHTQTKNHNRTTVHLNHEFLDDRSNLGGLFKALKEMGVSQASDDEGTKAVISKNGKAKPITFFLS